MVVFNTWLSPRAPKSLGSTLDVFQGGTAVEQPPRWSRVRSQGRSSGQVAQHPCTDWYPDRPVLYLHVSARALGQQTSKVLEFINLHWPNLSRTCDFLRPCGE